MDGEAMARFAAGAGLLGRGLSYAVVSIVGPQGSGERTLPPPSSSSHDHQFTAPPSPCREQSSLLILDACCVVDRISRLDDASSIFCCGSVFIFFLHRFFTGHVCFGDLDNNMVVEIDVGNISDGDALPCYSG